MKFALPLATRLAILSLLLCVPASAYEVEAGAVLICDTQGQAERFVQLFDGSPIAVRK